jgi:hypothetical protein
VEEGSKTRPDGHGFIQDAASGHPRIPLLRTPVNKAKKKGRDCYYAPALQPGRLRSDHERVHLLAPAKVTLVELELPVGGIVDVPAPLGTTVEIALVRRRGHSVRSACAAYGGFEVGVSVDGL